MSLVEPALSFSPLFLKLLTLRGFETPELVEKFIRTELSALEDPFKMKGMTEACRLIQSAIRDRRKILIHGDYDVDGVTGTTVVARTLSLLKADLTTFLPDRKNDGYGVSESAIRNASASGVSLLITVDCGVTAHRQIQTARELGMDVIVIDHHRIPVEGLPKATVILNPQQEDCPYNFKDLSAAGLAFKLSQALIGTSSFQFLDLAALSTVGDVAPLRSENRIIVKHGLDQLSSAKCNVGLKMLGQVAGIRARSWNSSHLGFVLGPRINAAGRMSSPEIALRLLMTENPKEAESLANILQEENKLRQKEERQTVKEAMQEVERVVNFNRDRVIVVARQGWHAGVIGIVASRLVDRFHRPALVIALDGEAGKGSGRSIKGFHLFYALESCKELFQEFGGHEQAVGLSILDKNVALFRKKVNEYAQNQVSADIFVRKVRVDLELSLQDLRSVFIQELKLLEPHGAGNPRPNFFTPNLTVKSRAKNSAFQAAQFHVSDGSMTCEVTWSNPLDEDTSWIEKGAHLHLTYTVKTKLWDGMESLVLEAKELQPAV